MICYILRGTVTGRFKIGISGSIDKRIASYRSSCSEIMDLVYIGMVSSR